MNVTSSLLDELEHGSTGQRAIVELLQQGSGFFWFVDADGWGHHLQGAKGCKQVQLCLAKTVYSGELV